MNFNLGISDDNIWIPHIPKNAGTTIIENVRKHSNDTTHLVDTTYWKQQKLLLAPENNSFSFYQFSKKSLIRLDHDNPLEKNMDNWLKILIVRDPLDRLISFYNWFNRKKYKISFNYFLENITLYKPIRQLQYLSFKQKLSNNPLVEKFTTENVKHVFDYIIDVSDIFTVFNIIENIFFGKKIYWNKYNTTDSGLNRNDITSKQLDKIFSNNNFLQDIKFYDYVTK